RPEIGADVTDLFNVLTGLSPQRTFRRLLVAPHSLRQGFIDLVEREMAHATAGREAHIILKLNAIVDVPVIEALYRAASAGVEIDLIVRGASSIQPGLPGISERIRVRSIVGEFLEHSRIWGFANGGDREGFIGSADLMDRNLDRRVEAVVPVEDSEAKAHIADIVELMLADARRSWQPHPAGARGGRGSVGSTGVTEIELKYRVGDLAAAERVLAADRLGPFTAGGRGARSTQLEDRYVDTADGALAR